MCPVRDPPSIRWLWYLHLGRRQNEQSYLSRKPNLISNTAVGKHATPSTAQPTRYITAFSTGSKVAMKPNMQKASSIKKITANTPHRNCRIIQRPFDRAQ